MITINSGDLDTVVVFERHVPNTEVMGAGKFTPVRVAEVRAQALDQLPPAGITSDAAEQEGWRCRLLIRFRTDITDDLFVIVRGRTGKIISGPSIAGRNAGLIMMVEGYKPKGSAA